MAPRRKRKGKEQPPQSPELEEAVASALVPAGAEPVPVLLTLGAVRSAMLNRDALALCPHATAEELVAALFAAAADPASLTWADVLAEARMPWVAWAMLRQQMPSEATEVFQVWAHRRADQLVGEALEDVRAIAGSDSNEVFASVAQATARANLKRWVAEKLDPEVYGRKVLEKRDEKSELVIRIVDEV